MIELKQCPKCECSNCGRERYACTIRNVNYYPNCGAKMEQEAR